MRRKKTVRHSLGASLALILALFLPPLFLAGPLQDELFGAEAEPDAVPEFSTHRGKEDGSVTLRVLSEGRVTEMALDEYLVGVVRAEMPASFPQEALKAQAVAARTYTLHRILQGGRHPEAHVCTDPTCCQAWSSEEAARRGWGEHAQTYEQAVENAVAATDGEVLTYGGEPILAVFHAASAGLTRAAGDVWQNDLPYLQSVESPENGETIPEYYSRAAFTAAEFRRRTAALHPDLSGSMDAWLQNPVTDGAGSVETVELGGVPVKGAKVRELLGLRSACFTWEVQGEKLVFFVTGYGHGVGMSQYGAGQLAAEGADYREILKHYYVDTELERLSGKWRQISAGS